MDIQQIIKERYKELPADIQEAIKSNDLGAKFSAIAEKHGLHVDQNGALQTETILVMLGLEPTTDYVNNLQRNLDISRTEALSLADDVNNDILNSIKNSLRVMQEGGEAEPAVPNLVPTPPANLPVVPSAPTAPSNTSLEKAGQFTIEKTVPISASSQYKEQDIDKEAILKSIEDKPVAPAASQSMPMVDHLLTTHVNAPEKIEIKEVKAPEAVKKEEPKKPYAADPYREQL